ncbi:MAG: ATP-binding protein, partial [Bacteroidales bacterium]|nr:ATP-binding protein [Bacteroidales bacterium]
MHFHISPICINSENQLPVFAKKLIEGALYIRLKEALIRSNKLILLYGARQTGKTTLFSQIIQDLPFRSLTVNADEIRYHDVLSSRDLNKMKM